jgi:hypothetical protein
MATNKKNELGFTEYLGVASGVLSNQPVQVGNLTGVATFDRDSANSSTVDFQGVYTLSVKGVNDAGNVAVAVGDPIYFISTDTPVLSKKASGTLFGYALAAVNSGATTSIDVLLVSRNNAPGGADISAVALRTNKIFVSAEQTGTGAPQNIAHGMGVVPTYVMASPTDTSPATAGVYTVTEGTHTTTNVVVTVTSGKKFKVLAIA